MKKIILLLFLLTFLFSCQKDKKDYYKLVDEKIKSELKTGVRNDTVVLGYYFGMSKDNVASKTRDLISKEKLFIDSEGFCRFAMTKNENPIFLVDYYNDKLYQVYLIFNDEHEFMNAKFNYLEKYDKPIVPDFNDSDYFDKEWVWINGNRMIVSTNYDKNYPGKDVIRYTDLSVKSLKEKQDEYLKVKKTIKDSIDAENRYKQTLNDI